MLKKNSSSLCTGFIIEVWYQVYTGMRFLVPGICFCWGHQTSCCGRRCTQLTKLSARCAHTCQSITGVFLLIISLDYISTVCRGETQVWWSATGRPAQARVGSRTLFLLEWVCNVALRGTDRLTRLLGTHRTRYRVGHTNIRYIPGSIYDYYYYCLPATPLTYVVVDDNTRRV